MKKIIIIGLLLLSISAESQIKRDTIVIKPLNEKKSKEIPTKKDTIILYNQFRDYVEWIEKQEKKKQK